MSGRNLDTVLGSIIRLIPDEQKSLRARLVKLRYKTMFRTPEAMGQLWRRVQAILVAEIGRPTKNWQKNVARAYYGAR